MIGIGPTMMGLDQGQSGQVSSDLAVKAGISRHISWNCIVWLKARDAATVCIQRCPFLEAFFIGPLPANRTSTQHLVSPVLANGQIKQQSRG